MATGVLLVCLGRATRVVEYLMAGLKRYRATVCLGVSTDSHDADGQVTVTAPVTATRADVEAALARFRGAIEQVPPMVSAVKHQGRPLYKLARQGITVQRRARSVEIYALTITDWSPPNFSLEMTCSSGTYVRALARDLGQALGCGAHLTALTRLASGDFVLEQSIALERFAEAVDAVDWQRLVMPMDAGLQHMPACRLEEQDVRFVRSGRPLPADSIDAPVETLCRIYAAGDSSGKLIALLKFDNDAQMWRPRKVFQPL
jgi:tRNA pseudouridine55 synthase